MRTLLAALVLVSLSLPAGTEELSSVYTDIDRDRTCTVFATASAGEGDWVAAGNDGANENARSIADAMARDSECGADQPSIDAGSVPVPSFGRGG